MIAGGVSVLLTLAAFATMGPGPAVAVAVLLVAIWRPWRR